MRACVGAVEHVMVFAGGGDGRCTGQLRLRGVGVVARVRRDRRRRHVVEEAVVLVEVDEQDRLAPAVGVGGQRVEHARDVVGARGGTRGTRVFGTFGSGDNPAHLRQAVGQHVGLEQVEVARAGAAIAQGGRIIGPAIPGVAERAKSGQRIIGEVVRHVLVDLPADARRFQAFRIGGPQVVGGHVRIEVVAAVVRGRAAGQGQGIVMAAEQEQAVRVGAGLRRAVIVVANGEGACERELERNVGLGVIAHRVVLLDRAPVVHAPMVPRQLGVEPGVRGPGHAHDREILHGIEPERRDGVALGPVGAAGDRRAAGSALDEHRLAIDEVLTVQHGNRKRIAEAAHPFEGAEVMVETAVLLRQHDNMLDVLQAAGAVVGGEGQRRLDGGWKGRKDGAGAGRLAH